MQQKPHTNHEHHHEIPGIIETDEYLKIPYDKSFFYKKELLNLLIGDEDSHYKRKDVSPLDFTNLDNIDTKFANEIIRKQIERLPNAKILYNKEKKELTLEGLNYISSIFNDTIDYYTKTFMMPVLPCYINNWKKEGNGNEKIKFKSHKQVVEFLQYNNNKKNLPYNRKTHCSLLKIAFAKNDLNVCQSELEHAKETFEEIKNTEIYPKFKNIKGESVQEGIHTDNNYQQIRTSGEISNKEQIYFFISGRTKGYDRALLKMLGNSEYTSSDAIKDIYGLRCEVKSKKDALFLLEYFRKHMGKGKIKHKNLLGKTTEEIQDTINEYEDLLDEDFLKEARKLKGEGNNKSSGDFQDVKTHLPCKDKNGKIHQVETQIVLVNNSNETGYAHHKIYETLNTIEALVRLQGFAPINLIKKYIEKCVITNKNEAEVDNENPELLYLGGLSNNQNFRELTKEEQEKIIKKAEKNILEHFKKNHLYELAINKKNNTKTKEIYTTRNQRNKFHEKEDFEQIYPKDIQVLFKGKLPEK